MAVVVAAANSELENPPFAIALQLAADSNHSVDRTILSNEKKTCYEIKYATEQQISDLDTVLYYARGDGGLL